MSSKLIPSDMFHDLEIIREVRNHFAHRQTPKFSEPVVARRVRRLRYGRFLCSVLLAFEKKFQPGPIPVLGPERYSYIAATICIRADLANLARRADFVSSP